MSTPLTGARLALAAMALALMSALFFTMTYVLNRASAIGGGHWAWMASLLIRSAQQRSVDATKVRGENAGARCAT